jgi:hypothetical protein
VGDRPSTSSPREVRQLGTGFRHTARVWNQWLGGKDNFPAEVHQFGAVGRKP